MRAQTKTLERKAYMKLSHLICNADVKESNISFDTEICAITSDSRKVTQGSLFVCIKGEKSDGHDYIASALEKGAVCVAVTRKPDDNVPYILVENSRQALALMLNVFHGEPWKAFKKVIGITGTNGKTTTSVMLKNIFTKAGYKVGLIGTMKYLAGDEDISEECSNNLLTTPDADVFFELLVKMRSKGVDCLIMEVSSHSLALHKIDGMHFNVGIFTNLTQDHMDLHGNFENYLAAKARLFEMCDTALLNFDDKAYDELAKNITCEKMTYSLCNPETDFSTVNLKLKGAEGIQYELLARELVFRVKVKIPGIFTVYNSLAAAACAIKCGVSVDDIMSSLSEMSPVAGRIDRVDIPSDFHVIIDFAHTPDALVNVIGAIKGFCEGRIITLFGCGGDRDHTKRPQMGKIAMQMSDYVIITSDNSRTEDKGQIIKDILSGIEGFNTPYTVIENRKEAIKFSMDMAKAGDVILLAGKGHEEYEIDATGKHHFSEREIVTEYFAQMGKKL